MFYYTSTSRWRLLGQIIRAWVLKQRIKMNKVSAFYHVSANIIAQYLLHQNTKEKTQTLRDFK